MFDIDPYPNRPKILFIGNPTSSHVQSWINLIADLPFNIRLFSSAEGYPPDNWKIKVYLTTKYPPIALDPATRLSWFPIPEEWYRYEEKIQEAIVKETEREILIRAENAWQLSVAEKTQLYQQEITEFLNWYTAWLNQSREKFQDLSRLAQNYVDAYSKLQFVVHKYIEIGQAYEKIFSQNETLVLHYKKLLAEYNDLLAGHKDLLAGHKDLLARHNFLLQTHKNLLNSYSYLQQEYDEIEQVYRWMMPEYSELLVNIQSPRFLLKQFIKSVWSRVLGRKIAVARYKEYKNDFRIQESIVDLESIVDIVNAYHDDPHRDDILLNVLTAMQREYLYNPVEVPQFTNVNLDSLQDFLSAHLANVPPYPIYPERPPKAPDTFFPIPEPQPQAETTQAWLAEIIKSWQPDIIHTFGLDAGSQFYFETRKQYQLEGYGKWVNKVFGGSDLALSIYDSSRRDEITRMFAESTHVLFDNQYYTQKVIEMGLLLPEKVCPISPVPGSGGIDVDDLRSRWDGMPSTRRIILWPKAYETIWSKALPVLMAIKNIWQQIQPFELYMLTATGEVSQWIRSLPVQMRQHIHAFEGVSRQETLDLMVMSRVMLSPSLVDGVPNSMYEAMACGAIPVVSPLETIKAVVNEENVIFVNNLDQSSIEAAIIRLMWDNALVDRMARQNEEKVKSLADTKGIRLLVNDYYNSLVHCCEASA